MTSTESILKRLAEVEAEKELLRARLLSACKEKDHGDLRRQTVFARTSPNVELPIASLEKVTKWLNRPTKSTSHSSLLDFFTQYERYNLIFDNIYKRLGIKDIVAISRT